MGPRATAHQTVGPFFHVGLRIVDSVAGPGVSGARVTIGGRVLDGDGKPVPDALLEIWQADAHGTYAHPEGMHESPGEPGFKGFGRVATDEGGTFRFGTITPGRVPGPGGRLQAPHLVVAVFMRGLLKHLVTRVYFPGEPSNADDPILNLVEPARRATLIARKAPGRNGVLEWNVILQGEGETVFFDA